MNYQETIQKAVQEFYDVTKAFAASRHYTLSYWWVKSNFGLDLNDEKVRDDIWEMTCSSKFCDLIQTLDFDNNKKEVMVMLWWSNNKKKYTINDYKEFCNNALESPPLDDFDDGNIDEEEWYKTHKIHIMVGNHDMELDYYADNVTEIYGALEEMYQIEKEINPDIKIFSDFDVYGHQYNYDEMKVITVLSAIDVNKELDYDDYMYIAEAVYVHWIDGRDASEDAKYQKYPWLEFQSSNEDNYIQLYAERVLPKFIELYKEVVL